MRSPWIEHGLELLIGASIGALLVAHFGYREAREHLASTQQHQPTGYLIWEANQGVRARYAMNLPKCFAHNPGSKVKLYMGTMRAGIMGEVSFAYQGVINFEFGDVILVRIHLDNGLNREFIVHNGAFGIIHQDDASTLRYAPEGV
jgi:hypothetical protein